MTTDYELRAQRSGLFPARLLSAVAVSMLLTCCLLVSGAAGAGTKAKSPVVVKVVTTKLGKTLVDAKGMTLYLLTADSRAKGKSVCYGTCAKYWPPLLATRTPKAGSGAKQALLGVAKRTGGTSQVTYRGHRLYLFKKDTKPGQVNGQRLHGFGGPFCTANLASKPCAWYAVSPSGSAITRTVNSGVQATATARNTVVTVTAGKRRSSSSSSRRPVFRWGR